MIYKSVLKFSLVTERIVYSKIRIQQLPLGDGNNFVHLLQGVYTFYI